MNFAVSAWQSADAWACEPTKRQVAESAESAAVGMCMVAAVVAAGVLMVSGRLRLVVAGAEEVPTILPKYNRAEESSLSRRMSNVCFIDQRFFRS